MGTNLVSPQGQKSMYSDYYGDIWSQQRDNPLPIHKFTYRSYKV